MNFFQPGSGSPSFGDNLTAVLNSLGKQRAEWRSSSCSSANSSEETQLNTNISNEETTIAAQRTTLTNELNQANFTLTEIPQQIQNINEIYSAITGFNQNQNG